MPYQTENIMKADFTDSYTASTPHAYISEMARLGYQIGEQAKPFCIAAVKLLEDMNNGNHPVRMLDVGCSYGLGSAFIKFGLTFNEIVDFYASHAPLDYFLCCKETRRWLSEKQPTFDLFITGLDISEPAIRFALDAGLINSGIARDFEKSDMLSNNECEAIQKCNLLISIGAIGYVTASTFSNLLKHFGKNCEQSAGPFLVMTVLRMFNINPIRSVLKQFGYHMEKVPDICLPQRRFADEKEKKKTLRLLHEKQIDTRYWEDAGKLYADVFIAAPHDQVEELLQKMVTVLHNNLIP